MLTLQLNQAFKMVGLLNHALHTNPHMSYEQFMICQQAYFDALHKLRALVETRECTSLKNELTLHGIIIWKSFFRFNDQKQLIVSPPPLTLNEDDNFAIYVSRDTR